MGHLANQVFSTIDADSFHVFFSFLFAPFRYFSRSLAADSISERRVDG
jgi:hypothetical protein